MNDTRIAWLLPTAWFYWQPSIFELKQLFRETKIFAGLFPGYAKGFENAIEVEIVGDRKVIAVTESTVSYGDNFTYLSPRIIPKLFEFRPHTIFSSSFGVWTILALLFKFIGQWKVVIAYEGSSPGVDYRNSFIRLTIRRIMVWLSDACITNSHAGKDYLITCLNATAADVFVQPYEVPDVRSLAEINLDLQFIPNSERKFNDLKRPAFIFVGSIVPRKGVKCLVEACRCLKEEGITDYNVLIVGDGLQRDELKKLSKTYALDEQIIWVGRVDYADIGTFFHHSDIFVLPTLEDTWGMVVLEAMLMGKPVLCSKGAGASELILDGQNGYCFDVDVPEQLAEVMKRLIHSPEQLGNMGHMSQTIMSRYSPGAASEMMSKVISYVTRTA